MSGLTYNGNPATAVKQYKANQKFAAAIDGTNAFLENSKGYHKKADNLIDQITPILSALKSDTQAVITISKLVLDLMKENPIGSILFKMHEVGFEAVFEMLSQQERVTQVESVTSVFVEFMDESLKAEKKLIRYDKQKHLSGPFAFGLMELRKRNFEVDKSKTDKLYSTLLRGGREIVAGYDSLLVAVIPGTATIKKFMAEIRLPNAESVFSRIGDMAIKDLISQVQSKMNGLDGNFSGLGGRLLSQRNQWASWSELSQRKPEHYLKLASQND